jgi:hypothetical protein
MSTNDVFDEVLNKFEYANVYILTKKGIGFENLKIFSCD